MKEWDKDQLIGTAVGNVQNLVGAISLGVPKKSQPKYLRERVEQAEKFLKNYRKFLNEV